MNQDRPLCGAEVPVRADGGGLQGTGQDRIERWQATGHAMHPTPDRPPRSPGSEREPPAGRPGPRRNAASPDWSPIRYTVPGTASHVAKPGCARCRNPHQGRLSDDGHAAPGGRCTTATRATPGDGSGQSPVPYLCKIDGSGPAVGPERQATPIPSPDAVL